MCLKLFSVLKYKQDTDVKFSDKIGKLTMHSTKKKIFRMSQKMVGVQVIKKFMEGW